MTCAFSCGYVQVAGDAAGITAFQLDIKCEGLSPRLLAKALAQAANPASRPAPRGPCGAPRDMSESRRITPIHGLSHTESRFESRRVTV